MSSSFAFVPRAVSRPSARRPASASIAPTVLRTTCTESEPNTRDPIAPVSSSRQSKTAYSTQDYANLFGVALSDYALWTDQDLRRIIGPCPPTSSPEENEGCELRYYFAVNEHVDQIFSPVIPLNYLLTRSSTLSPLNLLGSQAAIVKALRECASDVFDVRLLVSAPPSTTCFRNNPGDVGAYEIRRKDWVDALTRPYSREVFNGKTVYMVRCLSFSHREKRVLSRLKRKIYLYSTELCRPSYIISFPSCQKSRHALHRPSAYKTSYFLPIIWTTLRTRQSARVSLW